jgi:hypothetical protein
VEVGSGRWLALLLEDIEHRAELAERLLAGLLDRRQRALGLLGQVLVQVQRHPGLHVDQGQMVPKRVVEVPGDAPPLLAGPPARLLLPDPHGLGRPHAPDAHGLGGAQQHQQPGGQTGQVGK